MERNQMKNIVVLKNLPSNLVEEAFVILKSNKVAKSLRYIDKKEYSTGNENNKAQDYIIREAEMIICNYIRSVENKEKKQENNKVVLKYKWLRIYSIVVTIIFILFMIF